MDSKAKFAPATKLRLVRSSTTPARAPSTVLTKPTVSVAAPQSAEISPTKPPSHQAAKSTSNAKLIIRNISLPSNFTDSNVGISNPSKASSSSAMNSVTNTVARTSVTPPHRLNNSLFSDPTTPTSDTQLPQEQTEALPITVVVRKSLVFFFFHGHF